MDPHGRNAAAVHCDHLELAANAGSAADLLGLTRGAVVQITRT